MQARGWMKACLGRDLELRILPAPRNSLAARAAAALAVAAAVNGAIREAALIAGVLPGIFKRIECGCCSEKEAAAAELAFLTAPANAPSAALLDAALLAGCLPALATILLDGSDGAMGAAVMSMIRLARGSRRRCAALLAAGALPPLMACLKDGCDKVKETAAQALAALSNDGGEHAREAVFEAGALTLLVAMLAGAFPAAVQAAAAAALAGMAADEDSHAHSELILAAGAAQPLMALLLNGADCVRLPAARVLGRLPLRDGTWRAFCDAVIIPALVGMLSAGGAGARAAAALALAMLPLQEADARCVVAEGAIPVLVQQLSTNGDCTKAVAAAALASLAQRWVARFPDISNCGDIIVAAGALAPLLLLLLNTERNDDAQQSACRALCWLAHESAERCGAIIAAGALELLAAMLQLCFSGALA